MKGISVKNNEIKIRQLADDTSWFLANFESLQNLIQHSPSLKGSIDIRDYDFNDEELPLSPVKEVRFNATANTQEMKNLLRNTFKIKDESVILKMRNHRGSLIVMSNRLSSNSKTVPYILEVTRPHQTVDAKSRSVTRTKHIETLKRTLQSYILRLDRLDFEIPNLSEKRSEKIKKEMEEVDTKLQFLNKRISEADTRRWQGMFKKIPLW